jgi:hypothetical protein
MTLNLVMVFIQSFSKIVLTACIRDSVIMCPSGVYLHKVRISAQNLSIRYEISSSFNSTVLIELEFIIDKFEQYFFLDWVPDDILQLLDNVWIFTH